MIFWMATACLNNTTAQKEIVISGVVSLPEEEIETVGTVQLRAYREWTGENELRSPLLEIDDLKIDALGSYQWAIRVDREKDEGLVIYGWLDRNNDGVLCDLFSDSEPSGMQVLQWSGIEHRIRADIIFNQDCAGAESLYGDEQFIASDEDSGLFEE